MTAAVPPGDFDEARRLATLHSLALLDTEPEAEFDSLVALAAEMLNCPNAFLSLIDRDRQWLKAGAELAVRQTAREVAFCDHTIRQDGVMIVTDASLDPRFADNPFVTAANGIRFYAGAPVHAVDKAGQRQPIGALCVIDDKPRCLSDAGRRALGHLTTLAEALIAARAAARRAHEIAVLSQEQAIELERKDRVFRNAERLAQIGAWSLDLTNEEVSWSDGVFRIHGLPSGEMPGLGEALDFYPPESRARVAEALALTMATGHPFDVEEDFIAATGERKRVRSIAERDVVEGVPVALVGVFQDITERHALEMQLRHNADCDALTGIANRAAFNRVLELAIDRARRGDTPLLLALVDLDGFKEINDTLGHLAGDDVLVAVARRLKRPWLKGSFAARLGGDEFALIVEDPGFIANRTGFGERLQEELRVTVAVDTLTIAASGTIGLALLGPQDNVRDFVHAADDDLYTAKRARVGNRRRGERRREG